MFKDVSIFLITFLLLTSCQTQTPFPKPKAEISLEYPKPQYKNVNLNCPFSFEISHLTTVKTNDKCWVTLSYPLLNASIDITYKPIKNNLRQLLQDAEKLTYSHAIKADGITSQPYINFDKHIYATVYEVTGNAASQIQFHATDSLKHFITGALYFNAEPNYDSIYPAVKYIETDLKHLIESIDWK